MGTFQAVRPLGEDFEESVCYNFVFLAGGEYTMQWNRTFDAWSSQSEQHYGRWTLFKGQVLCETLSFQDIGDREVRYAPAGYKFELPIVDILYSGEDGVHYFQAADGSPPKDWELPARTGKEQSSSSSVWTKGMWQSHQATAPCPPTVPYRTQVRSNARFVDIDGEMHEVAGDIVTNWPEHEWGRLMRCRLRWGING